MQKYLLSGFLLMMALATFPATWASSVEWKFEVSLDDKAVGFHNFSLAETDGVQQITSTAEFQVRVLFVPVFTYSHENVERWQTTCLSDIDARTRVNRKRYRVEGQRRADQFFLGEDRQQTLPSCIRTFAYWNPELLTSTDRLLNAQTGKLEAVSVRPLGEDELLLNGETVAVSRLRLELESGHIDLTYTRDDQVWVGLETRMPGGQTLRYTPIEIPLSRT